VCYNVRVRIGVQRSSRAITVLVQFRIPVKMQEHKLEQWSNVGLLSFARPRNRMYLLQERTKWEGCHHRASAFPRHNWITNTSLVGAVVDACPLISLPWRTATWLRRRIIRLRKWNRAKANGIIMRPAWSPISLCLSWRSYETIQFGCNRSPVTRSEISNI